MGFILNLHNSLVKEGFYQQFNSTIMHYNIFLKQEINPFEKVNNAGFYAQSDLINKLNLGDTAEAKKINGTWFLIFPLDILNKTVLLQWHDELTGKFKINGITVYFRISDNIILCH